MSVNRLAFYKRNDLAVEATAKLKWQYWIVGEGEMCSQLKAKHVQLLGNLPHEEVLKLYKKADVFSLPSEVEGFGIVTLEAMKAGLPFVNSDIMVHQEIERVSHAGLLFKSGDVNDLVEKLKMLQENKVLYKRLSLNAQKFAKKYTLDRMVKETEEVYKSL